MAVKKRILVVDDDRLVQILFRRVAERLGAEAVTVSNAQEAKASLKEKIHFDLILIDLIMPFESGWELLDEIKRNAGTADTPVIVATGAVLSGEETAKLLRKTCAVVNKGIFDLKKFGKLLNDLL